MKLLCASVKGFCLVLPRLCADQAWYASAATDGMDHNSGPGRSYAHINLDRQDRKDMDLAELVHAAMTKGGLTKKAMLPSGSHRHLETVSLRHLTKEQKQRVVEEALQVQILGGGTGFRQLVRFMLTECDAYVAAGQAQSSKKQRCFVELCACHAYPQTLSDH